MTPAPTSCVAEQILHNRGSRSARTRTRPARRRRRRCDAQGTRVRPHPRGAARVKADPPRLSRFNKEQRDQLDQRLERSRGARAPTGRDGLPAPAALQRTRRAAPPRERSTSVQPTPTRASATASSITCARPTGSSTPRWRRQRCSRTRFRLFRAGDPAVELDELAAAFARYPRLPKLTTVDVLRNALVSGTQQGLFGLVSGSAWDAEDAVVRFRQPVVSDEVQFQPGTYVVRASAAQALVRDAASESRPPLPVEESRVTIDRTGDHSEPQSAGRVAPPRSLTISLTKVPSAKARDVVRGAVLPLAKANPVVQVDIVIHVDGGTAGVAPDDLDLSILEGLRQLGLEPHIVREPQYVSVRAISPSSHILDTRQRSASSSSGPMMLQIRCPHRRTLALTAV